METTSSGYELLSRLFDEIKGLRTDIMVNVRAVTGGAMNREAAASYLGISTRNLHDLVKAGKVKRIQISEGRYGFRRAELDRYLSDQECRSEADVDEEWFQKVAQ